MGPECGNRSLCTGGRPNAATLLGISRGGAIAVAYAVKHPERVNKLILYGAYPMGLNHYGTARELEERRALVSLTRLGWGVHNPAFCRMFTQRFIPNGTPVHENWIDDLQRMSTSAENAARLLETAANIDVRRLLRKKSCRLLSCIVIAIR
jgi:pimeloyl-ACP methyl ester carboxylesterase